jgi:predicted DNA-binding transcriptional regulator YafY
MDVTGLLGTLKALTIKTYADVCLLVLHRVRSAELSQLPVIRPEGFSLDDYLASGIFGWSVGAAVGVELIFSAEAVAHLHETPLASDQVIAPLADGRWRVTAMLPCTQQLRWWILAFGEAVEVVAPQQLHQSITDTARAMLARYA